MNNREILQKEAVERLCSSIHKCMGLHLTQRSGKTKVIIEYLKTLGSEVKVLIAYPDNKILESWQKEIEKWEFVNNNITFCNFSSLKKYVDVKYDVVVLDESQSLSNFELEMASFLLENCKRMVLPSGTFNRNTREQLALYLGMEIIYEYTSDEAIKAEVIADYKIFIHYIDLDETIKKKNSKGILKSEKQLYDDYTYVINSLKRQGKPVNKMLLLSRNRISQGSVAKIEYVKKLLQKNKDKRFLVFSGLANIADGLGIASFHTKSKSKTGFNDFQDEKTNHLALVGIGKAGVTYTNLDGLIMNGFVKNSEEVAQIMSRCQVRDYENKVAEIHLLCLNEPAEIKKLEAALELINKSKIVHVNKN